MIAKKCRACGNDDYYIDSETNELFCMVCNLRITTIQLYYSGKPGKIKK